MIGNFPPCLAFVWRTGFDSPLDGFHVARGDPGEGTNGGVIQATWDNAVRVGIVKGTLDRATEVQLSQILYQKFWLMACETLPAGLDLLLFNGRMMTGRFPFMFQQCLGFMGDEVDGWIGPLSIKAACERDTRSLIEAISGVHAAYLASLDTWPQFGHGWTIRLKAARTAAIAMIDKPPTAWSET
jgi:lysozyme family protein